MPVDLGGQLRAACARRSKASSRSPCGSTSTGSSRAPAPRRRRRRPGRRAARAALGREESDRAAVLGPPAGVAVAEHRGHAPVVVGVVDVAHVQGERGGSASSRRSPTLTPRTRARARYGSRAGTRSPSARCGCSRAQPRSERGRRARPRHARAAGAGSRRGTSPRAGVARPGADGRGVRARRASASGVSATRSPRTRAPRARRAAADGRGRGGEAAARARAQRARERGPARAPRAVDERVPVVGERGGFHAKSSRRPLRVAAAPPAAAGAPSNGGYARRARAVGVDARAHAPSRARRAVRVVAAAGGARARGACGVRLGGGTGPPARGLAERALRRRRRLHTTHMDTKGARRESMAGKASGDTRAHKAGRRGGRDARMASMRRRGTTWRVRARRKMGQPLLDLGRCRGTTGSFKTDLPKIRGDAR